MRPAAQSLAKAQWRSTTVRTTFLDYMCGEQGHTFVRSSSVIPRADPTLAFVNAGMNQFKEVLLGSAKSPGGCRAAANSQKCIRVGGKHNDLAEVGRDGTHHTFFEMLGSWTFGECEKLNACRVAWNLLTRVYGIPERHLCVTYFAGDHAQGIPPDTETCHVWQQLGVPESHIQGCNAEDNFWEMGLTGPCGPCTEIHYMYPGGLRELWNIVFIQYDRLPDGTLRPLAKQHVDTGLGFERLVALLQGRDSNYDTDLFTGLTDAVQRRSQCSKYGGGNSELDIGYRVVSDHARMATVALADGCLPHVQAKLRTVLRRAFDVSSKVFKVDRGLIKELTNHVAESLGHVYPEIQRNLNKVQHIVEAEEELLYSLRGSACSEWRRISAEYPQLEELDVTEAPGLVEGFGFLKNTVLDQGCQSVPAEVAWRLNETYGVPTPLVHKLAQLFKLQFDEKSLEAHWAVVKSQQRQEWLSHKVNTSVITLTAQAQEQLRGMVPTDDSSKYKYQLKQGTLHFPEVKATVKGILVDGQLTANVTVEERKELCLVVDRTGLYCEAGGQHSDRGTVLIDGRILFDVDMVLALDDAPGIILHVGRFKSGVGSVSVQDTCTVRVDAACRIDTMCNHTATHLLNAALAQVLTVSSQQSSRVTDTELLLDVAIYRQSLGLEDLNKVEWLLGHVIRNNVSVTRSEVRSAELSRMDYVTFLPGEVYPTEGTILVQVDAGFLLSREPCCGTHVPYSGLLQDLVITSCKSVSQNVKSIQAVTGHRAKEARRALAAFEKKLQKMRIQQVSDPENCDVQKLKEEVMAAKELPHVGKVRLLEKLEPLVKQRQSGARARLKEDFSAELRRTLIASPDSPYLVKCLDVTERVDKVQLHKLTQLCPPQLPVLLLAYDGSRVKGRCEVPHTVEAVAAATAWMGAVGRRLKASVGVVKTPSSKYAVVLNSRTAKREDVEEAVKEAASYAQEAFR